MIPYRSKRGEKRYRAMPLRLRGPEILGDMYWQHGAVAGRLVDLVSQKDLVAPALERVYVGNLVVCTRS